MNPQPPNPAAPPANAPAAPPAQPQPSLNYCYRLLAFGALSSGLLYRDILNHQDGPLKTAADQFQSDRTPANFVPNGKAYLKALGFPAAFAETDGNDGMPWSLIDSSGLKAMRAVVEADDFDYPTGGCQAALQAALQAIAEIAQ